MANYTILLIDYEPRSIERFRDPLIGAGYAVELATDGIAGVEAFHRLNPDMVLVEAMIPKKHGFEVCQELKRTPHGRRTPVIITTGVYKGRKYRTQALHIYGCDEYIEKPIAPAQLLEIVGRFLGPGVAAPSAESTAPLPVTSGSGGHAIARENVDAIAKPGPSVVQDDGEEEITARLDALLSGKGSENPLFAAPEKVVVAASVVQDPFAQMRAELDAELGAISSPITFETAPTLEPIVEPLCPTRWRRLRSSRRCRFLQRRNRSLLRLRRLRSSRSTSTNGRDKSSTSKRSAPARARRRKSRVRSVRRRSPRSRQPPRLSSLSP